MHGKISFVSIHGISTSKRFSFNDENISSPHNYKGNTITKPSAALTNSPRRHSQTALGGTVKQPSAAQTNSPRRHTFVSSRQHLLALGGTSKALGSTYQASAAHLSSRQLIHNKPSAAGTNKFDTSGSTNFSHIKTN